MKSGPKTKKWWFSSKNIDIVGSLLDRGQLLIFQARANWSASFFLIQTYSAAPWGANRSEIGSQNARILEIQGVRFSKKAA